MSFKYYNERTGQYEVLTVPTLKGERGERGEPGVPGAKGEAGLTPNLTIGTVVTLEPEREASVAIRGTKENPILDISIPRGGRGEKGIFVGSKEDAPLSAEIVIDHSDEGPFIGGSIEEELVEVPIIDGVLTLTKAKYQTTTMENNTTVVLPVVDKLTEIHLFFYATDDLTLTMPNVGWQSEPNIEFGRTYEFIFTYTTEWLGGSVSYYAPPKAPIMNGLVGWFDAKDFIVNSNNMIANDTVWANRVKGGNDAIVKTISGNEVQGKDGDYFRTNGDAYVGLPSFEANSTDGLSIYVDAKINQRPTERYERIFTLGYGLHYDKHLTLEGGVTDFGKIRNFNEIPSTALLDDVNADNFPVQMKIGVSVGSGFASNKGKAKNYINGSSVTFYSNQIYNSTFDNNFLCAENPTTLGRSDVSYGLILIYNRALTEKEMQYNYKYSLAIQRG